MRVLGLVFVLVFAMTGTALAEKVKANQAAKLLNRPGEQGKVLYKIKEGQNMTLLGQEGRWLKVRVGGRTGFVPRSKVEMSDNEELARNTRHRPFVGGRSTNRGFNTGEGPDDRVGADALGETSSGGSEEEEPKSKAKSKSKGGDDEEEEPKSKPKAKAKSKGGDDEEEEPKSKAKAKSKGGDDEEVSTSDDEEGGKGGEEATEADDRPRAHVSSKTKVFDDRDKNSDVKFVAKPSDVLYPTDTKGKWTMVENDEGDAGWVLSNSLDQDGGGGGGKPAKRVIDLNARLGISFIQQGMRTQGTTKVAGMDQVPDVYNIGTSAGTLAIGGMLLFPVKVKYLFGGEMTFDGTKTLLGGVNYMSTTTALTIGDFNLRAVFAYPTARKSGLTILARLGFRYRGYQVADYQDPAKNPAKIPQETLKAPTLGVALQLPMLTDKVGLQLGLDAILFGASIDQTAGLEDGATPSMSSVHVNVGFIYRFNKTYNLCGAYDLDYAGYDFGVPNMGAAMQSTRGHTGTDVSRTDILHTVSFGIQKGF